MSVHLEYKAKIYLLFKIEMSIPLVLWQLRSVVTALACGLFMLLPMSRTSLVKTMPFMLTKAEEQ